jgi:hypothetical protein
MELPTEPLTPREHQRLVASIEREAPELRNLACDAVNARWLTDDEAGALNGIRLNVFLRSLDQEDEPSREGVEADHRGYWDRWPPPLRSSTSGRAPLLLAWAATARER